MNQYRGLNFRQLLIGAAAITALGAVAELVCQPEPRKSLEEVALQTEANYGPGRRYATTFSGEPLALHIHMDRVGEVILFDAGADGTPDSAVVTQGGHRYTYLPGDSTWNWEPRYQELRNILFGGQ